MGKQSAWAATFASLRVRNFRLFSIGILFSFIALQMQTLTLNYVVYQLSGSAKEIGYINAAIGLAILVFSFAGGIAADRIAKRNLMVMTQAGMALCTVALGVLISLNVVRIEHLFVFAVLYGAVSAINMVARQSYVPELAGVENLTNAQGLMAGNMSLTRIIGPAIAGLLIGMYGAAPAFYIKALGHGLFIILLLLIPVAGLTRASSGSILGAVIDGARYLRNDRKVLDLLLLGTVPLILGASYLSFLPVFQKVVFRVGPSELGLMFSITGIGAVAGSLAIARLNSSRHKSKIMFVTGAGFGAGLLLFGITAGVGNFPASLAMLALVGASGTAFVAINSALVQAITPPEMHGRVQAIFIAGIGLMSLGALPMGTLVDAIGPSLTMGIFGGTTLLFVVVMTLLRRNLWRI
ncbi:MAG: MFS transporter [Dehalococcoidales bacterium]|nr:MFS transporter [Dehalococcoidales bacterium]